MSLVHEALQKAEREKQRKLGTAPSQPISYAAPHPVSTPVVHTPVGAAPVASHKPAAPVEQPPKTNNVLLPVLIGCVAIVATVAVVFLVSNATSVLRQSKESTPVAASAAPAPAAQSTSPAVPLPIVTPPIGAAAPASVPVPAVSAPAVDESKYKLSGIMKDPDGKPVAVLNGRVAYEGYFIDGATVKKIETDRAILDVKGQEVVLRLF
jgi:hypothetical protein